MRAGLVGVSESGKTTLGKELSKALIIQKKEVIVLTPIWEDWGTDLIFTDEKKFLDYYWTHEGLYAFLDEGGDTVGRYNEAMLKVATQGRHLGHTNHFLMQGYTMVSPAVRGSWQVMYLFSVGNKEAQAMAEEWREPKLLEAPTLDVGEFIKVYKFRSRGETVRGSIDIS